MYMLAVSGTKQDNCEYRVKIMISSMIFCMITLPQTLRRGKKNILQIFGVQAEIKTGKSSADRFNSLC